MFRRIEKRQDDTIEIVFEGKQYCIPNGISVAAALIEINAEFNRKTPIAIFTLLDPKKN